MTTKENPTTAKEPRKARGKPTAAEQTELLPADMEEGKPALKEALAAVKMGKVKPEVVKRWLVKWSLVVPTGATPAQLVETALDYQLKMHDEDDLADCDNCHGISATELPECPYCGVGEEDDSKEPEQKVEPEAGSNGSKAIVPAKPAELANFKEKIAELNEKVKRVHDLKTAAVICYWDIGKAVYEIYVNQLYKVRVDDECKARYKSFDKFSDVELGISGQHARNFMDVALAFTRDQVAKFGVTKLLLATKIPEEDRQRLIEKMAEDGDYTSSQIAMDVKQQLVKNKLEGKVPPKTVAQSLGGSRAKMGEAGKRGQETRAAQREAIKAAAKKQEDAGRVTVASLLGRITIPLFCGAHGKGQDKSKVRAQRIGDEPVGTEDMVNGVVVRYRLGQTAKGLVLVVDRSRGTAAEEPAVHTQTKADKEKPAPKAKATKKPKPVKAAKKAKKTSKK